MNYFYNVIFLDANGATASRGVAAPDVDAALAKFRAAMADAQPTVAKIISCAAGGQVDIP